MTEITTQDREMTSKTTIHNLHKKLDQAEAGVEELRRAVEVALKDLSWMTPDWVIDKVRKKTNELTRTANTELEEIRIGVEGLGEPWKLRDAAEEWSTGVKAELTKLPGKISWSQLTADDEFAGRSADAYKQIRVVQKIALAAVAGFPNPISRGLNDIASAIDQRAAAYTVAILALAGSIVSAVVTLATSATGVGLLVGLGTTLTGLLTMAGAFVYADTQLSNAVETLETDWKSALSDFNGFDGEHWPEAKFPQPPVASFPTPPDLPPGTAWA